jgi:hypothetical protein
VKAGMLEDSFEEVPMQRLPQAPRANSLRAADGWAIRKRSARGAYDD